jgi:hypothetical protein
MLRVVTLALAIIAVCFSGLSLLVAGWAAYTSHQARLWQRRRDAERLETRVRIAFSHSVGEDERYIADGFDESPPRPPMVYSVTLDAINEGESTEYVTAAWLEQASDGPRLVEQIYPPNPGGGDGPFELRPRATLSVEHYLSHADLAWMRDGFYGRVELGSGAEVRSEREMLSAGMLEQVTPPPG